MNFDEIVDSVREMDAELRVELAKDCVLKMCDGFARLGMNEEQMSEKICDVIRLFVSADRRCSPQEFELINAIYEFDMTYQEFYDLTNGGAQVEFIMAMDHYIDSLEKSLKSHIGMFGLCLLASDGEVTHVERALLKRILL